MGKVNLPCNLTPEEAEEALEFFHRGWLTPEEEAEIIDKCENYLFYETHRRGDSKEMHCSFPDCGSFIQYKYEDPGLFGLKHGATTRCPHCGRIVKLMAMGRMRTFSSINRNYVRITVCRPAPDGGLLLMSGWAWRDFYEDDLRPGVYTGWKVLTYLKPGKRMQWEKRYNPIDNKDEWYAKKTVGEPFCKAMSYYDPAGDSYFIGARCIGETDLRYCQLEDWLWTAAAGAYDLMESPVRGAVKYLSAYTAHPNIEMAVKIGLPDAVADLVDSGIKHAADLNWKSKKVQDFLRLPKQECNAFLRYKEPSVKILNLYHRENKAGTFPHMQDMLEAIGVIGGPNGVENLNECCQIAGCTAKKACNYIKKQPGSGRRALQMWKDYLGAAQELQYDLKLTDVSMPKNLQERHDAAYATIEMNKNEISTKKYKKMMAALKEKYEFTMSGLSIVVPKSAQEIVNEGKTLHHCVGGYASRHIAGETVILFVRHRRKPRTPFLTMEIVPRKKQKDPVIIRQVHGYKNEIYRFNNIGTDPEIKYAWLFNAWRDWVESGSPRNKDGSPMLPEEKEKTA